MRSLNINILTPHGPRFSKISIDDDTVVEMSFEDRSNDPLLLVPSFIDMHVHFRDFLQCDKETVRSGSIAALAGGASAVCDMPNTDPPVADVATFLRRKKLFSEQSLCDYLINFCVFDEESLSQAEKVDPFFIKVYLEETTGRYVLDEELLESVFKLGRPIALHSHIAGIKNSIKLSKKYGTHLHVCHVSTKEEVLLLKKNKDENITCEVTPHHLFLSGDYSVRPPLSKGLDREALWKELGDTIDIVSSDHAPHTPDDKKAGAYGVSGVETLMPLMLTALNRGNISYRGFCFAMHLNQGLILQRLGRRFGLDVGGRADFAIVRYGNTREIDPKDFYSKAKHSPFEGMTVDASIKETWVRGNPFFIDGELTKYALGKEVEFMPDHKA